MATDPRDPAYLELLNQLGNDDQVGWKPSSSDLLAPRLKYDMSGALNPRNDPFASQDGRQIFFNLREPGVIVPERLKQPINDIGEEFFYRTGVPLIVNSGFRRPPNKPNSCLTC